MQEEVTKNIKLHTNYQENTYCCLPAEDVSVEADELSTDVQSSMSQNLFLHCTRVICTRIQTVTTERVRK